MTPHNFISHHEANRENSKKIQLGV